MACWVVCSAALELRTVGKRTVRLALGVDVKVVVPGEWIKSMREQAKDPLQTTPFLVAVDKQYEDDEDFCHAILKNGLRLQISNSVADLLHASNFTGSVSPVKIISVEPDLPADVQPVLASNIDVALGLPTEQLG